MIDILHLYFPEIWRLENLCTFRTRRSDNLLSFPPASLVHSGLFAVETRRAPQTSLWGERTAGEPSTLDTVLITCLPKHCYDWIHLYPFSAVPFQRDGEPVGDGKQNRGNRPRRSTSLDLSSSFLSSTPQTITLRSGFVLRNNGCGL
jgi:hypothetical protein